jgi:hypothetical protein
MSMAPIYMSMAPMSIMSAPNAMSNIVLLLLRNELFGVITSTALIKANNQNISIHCD